MYSCEVNTRVLWRRTSVERVRILILVNWPVIDSAAKVAYASKLRGQEAMIESLLLTTAELA
jgi:hypothetical protein